MSEFEKRESFMVDDSLLGLELVLDMDGENYNIRANFGVYGFNRSLPIKVFVDPETGNGYIPGDDGGSIGYTLKSKYVEEARNLAREKGIQLQTPTSWKQQIMFPNENS